MHAIHAFVEPFITTGIEWTATSRDASSRKGRALIFQIFARENILKHIVQTTSHMSHDMSNLSWHVEFYCQWLFSLLRASLKFLPQWLEKVNKEWFQHKQTSCVFQGNRHPLIMLDMKAAVWHVQHESQWKITAVLSNPAFSKDNSVHVLEFMCWKLVFYVLLCTCLNVSMACVFQVQLSFVPTNVIASIREVREPPVQIQEANVQYTSQ